MKTLEERLDDLEKKQEENEKRIRQLEESVNELAYGLDDSRIENERHTSN